MTEVKLSTAQQHELAIWQAYLSVAETDVRLYAAEQRTDMIGRALVAIRDRYASIVLCVSNGLEWTEIESNQPEWEL